MSAGGSVASTAAPPPPGQAAGNGTMPNGGTSKPDNHNIGGGSTAAASGGAAEEGAGGAEKKAPEMGDFYVTLGVEKTASAADIKKSYRKLVIKWHPDKHPSEREKADDMIRDINNAYETLSNPAKKQAYDEQLAALERKRNGIQLPTAGIAPRMVIPKEFMLCPLGDSQKFIRYQGSNLFVQSREDLKSVEFIPFFEKTKFNLYWLPEVNNMCRIRPAATAQVGHSGGQNLTFADFNAEGADEMLESELHLAPGQQGNLINFIAVPSPTMTNAFRFECAYYPGAYLAYKEPNHLRVKYDIMFKYVTMEEVLIPTVKELPKDHHGYVQLEQLMCHDSIIMYFRNILGTQPWDLEDFETYFDAHWQQWYYSGGKVKLRTRDEQLAHSLRKAKKGVDLASPIAEAELKGLEKLHIETVERALMVLFRDNSGASIQYAVDKLTAQKKLLQVIPAIIDGSIVVKNGIDGASGGQGNVGAPVGAGSSGASTSSTTAGGGATTGNEPGSSAAGGTASAAGELQVPAPPVDPASHTINQEELPTLHRLVTLDLLINAIEDRSLSELKLVVRRKFAEMFTRQLLYLSEAGEEHQLGGAGGAAGKQGASVRNNWKVATIEELEVLLSLPFNGPEIDPHIAHITSEAVASGSTEKLLGVVRKARKLGMPLFTETLGRILLQKLPREALSPKKKDIILCVAEIPTLVDATIVEMSRASLHKDDFAEVLARGIAQHLDRPQTPQEARSIIINDISAFLASANGLLLLAEACSKSAKIASVRLSDIAKAAPMHIKEGSYSAGERGTKVGGSDEGGPGGAEQAEVGGGTPESENAHARLVLALAKAYKRMEANPELCGGCGADEFLRESVLGVVDQAMVGVRVAELGGT
eukprot:g6070.t1